MLRSALLLGFIVFHQLHARPALACGATPDQIVPLLPAKEAVDVPVNAALFASANLRSTMHFELSELAGGDEDGGGPVVPVPLTVECEPGGGGALCLARPEEPLKPRTQYSWMVRGEMPDGGADSAERWQSFETGEARAEVPSPEVSVSVARNVRFESHPCGSDRVVGLKLENQGSAPAVTTVPGVTPGYVTHALALGPHDPDADWSLYGPPACFEVLVYDETGASQRLPEICPDEVLPPSWYETEEETGSVVDAGAAEPSDAEGVVEDAGGEERSGRDAEEERSGDASASGSDTAARGPSSTRERDELGRRLTDDNAAGGGGCALADNPGRAPGAGWLLALGLGLGLGAWRRRRPDGVKSQAVQRGAGSSSTICQ